MEEVEEEVSTKETKKEPSDSGNIDIISQEQSKEKDSRVYDQLCQLLHGIKGLRKFSWVCWQAVYTSESNFVRVVEVKERMLSRTS